jgi:hypothetical protein
MGKEEQIKKIAEQLKKAEYLCLDRVPLQAKDIEGLTNNQVLSVEHKKGFKIDIRKEFRVELMLGIPTLMYATDKFIVADEIMGQHGVNYNAEDMAEYINGLLSVYDGDF